METCGCYIDTWIGIGGDKRKRIIYCPKHQAADRLIQMAHSVFSDDHYHQLSDWTRALVDEAIAAAEGKPCSP